jgi:3-oxoacyl-[acyl-carrier protein] reductase
MIQKMAIQPWQNVIDVHFTGAFYWLQAAGRHMIRRARAGDKGGGAAAKAGMFGLTKTAARECSYSQPRRVVSQGVPF